MIKSRIKIMRRSKSALPARLKPLLVVPVALCLTLIFACSYLEPDMLTDNLKAGQTEVVLDIEDLRNLTAEEQTKFFESRKQPQHHDVEVYRVSSTAYTTEEENDFGEWEGYEILFYISEDGTLRKGPFIAADVNEDYDKAYYHWQNDTVLIRLENSRTEKEHARFRGTFPEDGSSSIETLQIPEHGINRKP